MAQRHLFAIDPGDANNGFCYFKYDPEKKVANVKAMHIFNEDGLDDMLKVIWGIGQAPDRPEIHFVVENFRVDAHVRNKVFQWSEAVTVRQIGKVKMLARWMDSKFTLQEPGNVLPMARKWSVKVPLPKSGHIRDDKSAYVHGVHYMMKLNWISTDDQVTLMGQERLV